MIFDFFLGGGSQAAFSSSYQFTSTFVKIHIRDVHVRYEDDISQPGHVHAAGFILKSLGKRNLFFKIQSSLIFWSGKLLVFPKHFIFTFYIPQAFFCTFWSRKLLLFLLAFFFAFCNNLKKFSFRGFERDCKRNFKWHSMQRWQCRIHNGTLKSVVWSSIK